jgi:transcriptional regulator with XRE-family HTH domain
MQEPKDAPEHRQLFAKAVKDARKRAGWTRKQLAKTAGIDPSYITLIEGNYKPAHEKVKKLALALALPEDELLLLAGYAPDSPRAFMAALDAVRIVVDRKLPREHRRRIKCPFPHAAQLPPEAPAAAKAAFAELDRLSLHPPGCDCGTCGTLDEVLAIEAPHA